MSKEALKLADNQLRLTVKAIDVILELTGAEYYPNDHYRSVLNKLRNDEVALLTFLE